MLFVIVMAVVRSGDVRTRSARPGWYQVPSPWAQVAQASWSVDAASAARQNATRVLPPVLSAGAAAVVTPLVTVSP
jgi:hypothetical protein